MPYLKDPDLEAKWISLLTSGKFQKGTGTLFDPLSNHHCALGILCIAAGIDLGQPPDNVYHKLNPLFSSDKDGMNEIARFNDEELYTFKEIAQIIEMS